MGKYIYFALTEKVKKKVGNFSSADEYKLDYGEDFYVYSERLIGDDFRDVTEYLDIKLDGCVMTMDISDTYEIDLDITEFRSGTTPDEFRKSLRKHAVLLVNTEKQEWDPEDLKIEKIVSWDEDGEDVVISDDKALGDLLKTEEEEFRVDVSAKIKNKKGEKVTAEGCGWFELHKNAYNIYLDEFEEVASATGASFERTEHDFMVNLYAIKNDKEKIRVGSLGDKERFRLRVFDQDDFKSLNKDERNAYFSKIRPGDVIWEDEDEGILLEYEWRIPDETREEGKNSSKKKYKTKIKVSKV